jgi:prepilin-type N-terminal cleavage/methylation domain-containing protein
VLTSLRRRGAPQDDEAGFTIIEVMFATAILLIVLAMVFSTLVSLTNSEDRAQRLVSNEQNVRFELDQLAREIRASNPLVPLVNATTAADYENQIEMVLGPTGGTQTVVRWTYDTAAEQMVRQVMSDTSATATVVSQSFLLTRVRNVETGTPVFGYFGQDGTDLIAQSLNNGGNINDAANCAVRVHIALSSDSNPGPVPFTETQDVEIRNRIPGMVECQPNGGG